MAKDTITARWGLEADYDTIQAMRQTLAAEPAQTELISLLRETVTNYLRAKGSSNFSLEVTLKVSPVPKIQRGTRLPTPKVENGWLSWYDPDADRTNMVDQVGSEAWLVWLEQEWCKSFRYQSEAGSFTAIKEKRRGRSVWYAHRRRGGRLKRLYLGKSENLTATKLAETARKLNSQQPISLTTQ